MSARCSLALLLSLPLCGCALLSRSEQQYYSLQPLPSGRAVSDVGGPPIGIGVLQLPPGLERREIVVRREEHRLQIRGTHLWASPFEEMVLHTVAFDLAERLPEGAVVFPGQLQPAAMREVDLIVEELSAGPDPEVVLDVRWTVGTDARGEGVPRREHIVEPIDSLDSADVAAGISRALAALTDRIAAALASHGCHGCRTPP